MGKPETWTVVYGAIAELLLEDDWALTLSAQQQQLHGTFSISGECSRSASPIVLRILNAPGCSSRCGSRHRP
jgi:hypothetical protein